MEEYHNSVKPQIVREFICPFFFFSTEKWTVQGTENDSQSNALSQENTRCPVTSIDPQNNDWRIINLRTKIENYGSDRSLRVLIDFSLFLPVSCIYEIPWKGLEVTPTAEASVGCQAPKRTLQIASPFRRGRAGKPGNRETLSLQQVHGNLYITKDLVHSILSEAQCVAISSELKQFQEREGKLLRLGEQTILPVCPGELKLNICARCFPKGYRSSKHLRRGDSY